MRCHSGLLWVRVFPFIDTPFHVALIHNVCSSPSESLLNPDCVVSGAFSWSPFFSMQIGVVGLPFLLAGLICAAVSLYVCRREATKNAKQPAPPDGCIKRAVKHGLSRVKSRVSIVWRAAVANAIRWWYHVRKKPVPPPPVMPKLLPSRTDDDLSRGALIRVALVVLLCASLPLGALAHVSVV